MNAEAKIDEGKKLLAQLDTKQSPKAGGPYGSDLSVLLDKIWGWIKTALAQQTGGNVSKTVLRFIYETALPKLKDYTPTVGDVAIDVAIMAIKAWHESIPEPSPA
jgi:hypothetical protein